MPKDRDFRFVSWNVNHGRADPELIVEQAPDAVALQEVRRAFYDTIRPRFAGGHFSLDLWEPLGMTCDHTPNRHGTAVLWSSTFREQGTGAGQPRPPELLPHLVAPWKLLAVNLGFTRNIGYFTVASYHALNGRCGPDGFDKPRLTLQVADWLEHQPGPVLIGMDANSPAVDHPDHDRSRYHFRILGPGDFEPRLLGAQPRHRGRDVLRTWLDAHPDRMAALRQERPDGPLAVSHRLKGGGLVRYDHVLATPGFEVLRVDYLDDGFRRGSDHALVVCDLRVQVEPDKKSPADALLRTRLLADDPEVDLPERS